MEKEKTLSTKTEEWRPIVEYPTYWASNLGRIKRIARNQITEVRGKQVIRRLPEKILKASYHDYCDATLSVRLVVRNTYIGIKVHSLVGLAFLGTAKVKHIDGNVENNQLSNLEIKKPRNGKLNAMRD